MSDSWQPAASLVVLKQRASLWAKVREFMAGRGILEVETPVLSHAGTTDPNLDSFTTTFKSPVSTIPESLYLHTSPEFGMKRLLAAGSGSIYQICHVFRNEELGRHHQPEFTMLEWYRIHFDHHKLMDELDDLLLLIGLSSPSVRHSYAFVFEKATGIDPHRASLTQLQDMAIKLGLQGKDHSRSILLDFIFSARVMPGLGQQQPELIYDFPVCQAALARIRTDDPPVAERFELFIKGIEIANGFHELTDANEQQERFEADNRLRMAMNKPPVCMDKNLLAALQQGLPACAGVALGMDRLLMVIVGHDTLDQVVNFTFNQA